MDEKTAVGIPDLPRTLEAVMRALPPLNRSEAFLELYGAQHPEGYAEAFGRWWTRASSWMTPGQIKAHLEAVENGTAKMITREEMNAKDPVLKESWERAVAEREGMTEADLDAERQRVIQEDEEDHERALRYAAILEELLNTERVYRDLVARALAEHPR